MGFHLHVEREAEVPVVSHLEALSKGFPNSKCLPSSVHLVKDPNTDAFFLMATDGVVVRAQRLDVFWSRSELDAHHKSAGPVNEARPLSAWIEDDGQDPLPDLTVRPLRLVRKDDEPRTWDLVLPSSPTGEPTLADRIPALLLGHLRPIPPAFRSWLFLMSPVAMLEFSKSFPEDLQPPVLFVPELQPDTDGRGPWAKYWAFHARTSDPLGVVMGVRSRETVERFTPKK